jgi:hypothetical protein
MKKGPIIKKLAGLNARIAPAFAKAPAGRQSAKQDSREIRIMDIHKKKRSC